MNVLVGPSRVSIIVQCCGRLLRAFMDYYLHDSSWEAFLKCALSCLPVLASCDPPRPEISSIFGEGPDGARTVYCPNAYRGRPFLTYGAKYYPGTTRICLCEKRACNQRPGRRWPCYHRRRRRSSTVHWIESSPSLGNGKRNSPPPPPRAWLNTVI